MTFRYLHDSRPVVAGDRAYLVNDFGDGQTGFLPVRVVRVNAKTITIERADGSRIRVTDCLSWRDPDDYGPDLF